MTDDEKPMSEATQAIYNAAVLMLGGDSLPLDFGPGHLVWAEWNLDYAEWCLEHFDEYRSDYSEEQLAVAKWALQGLILIPVDER